VAPAAVLGVVAGRVSSIEVLHAVRELLAGALDHGVVVRSHQAEGAQLPAETANGEHEQSEEEPPVIGVAEEQALGNGEAADVVDAVRKLRPRDPCHPLRR
jgi:hypothetical protein